MQLHTVERPSVSSVAHGQGEEGLTVSELEHAMNAVHAEAHTSDICGYDQWNDFHFGVATKGWKTLSEIIPQIEALGYKYHTGTSTWHDPHSDMLTLFAMLPNGSTAQLHNVHKGSYEPSMLPVRGHSGLCDIGPACCKLDH